MLAITTADTYMFASDPVPGQKRAGRDARLRRRHRRRFQLRSIADRRIPAELQQPEKQQLRRKRKPDVAAVAAAPDAHGSVESAGRPEQPVLLDAVQQRRPHELEDGLHDAAGVLEQPDVRQPPEPPPAVLADQRSDDHVEAVVLAHQDQGTSAQDAKDWKEQLQSSMRKNVNGFRTVDLVFVCDGRGPRCQQFFFLETLEIKNV